MAEIDVIKTEAVIVEGHLSFTLVSLCQASGALPDQVHALVAEGLLTPSGQDPDEWRFAGEALALTRRALRLARDLELGLSGAALVMDLLAEIEGLKARLRRR
jgi:chaperone modulatory protein CbpM